MIFNPRTLRPLAAGKAAVGVAAVMWLLAAPHAVAINLVEAYQRAQQHDPDFRAALAERESTAQEQTLGRAGLLPSVSFNAMKAWNSADRTFSLPTGSLEDHVSYQGKSQVLSLRQPLYNSANLAKYRLGISRASQGEARFEFRKQELITRLMAAYFDVLVARGNVDLLDSQIKLLEQQVARAREMFKGGEGTVQDVEETQARRDVTLVQGVEARDALEIAARKLRNIIGEEIGPLPAVKEEFPTPPPLQPENLEGWIELATTNNPELTAKRHEIESLNQEVAKSRAGHLPTLDLAASVSRTSQDSITQLNQDIDSKSVALQLAVPIYSGGFHSALTAQSLANLARAREEFSSLLNNKVHMEIRQQYLGVKSGERKISALRRAVKSSEIALVASQMGRKAGERTVVDVLNAQQQLFTVRKDLAQAKATYLLSRLRLKLAAGMLSDQDLGEVSRYLE